MNTASSESAHLAVHNEAVCIFSYGYIFEAAKSNSVKQ